MKLSVLILLLFSFSLSARENGGEDSLTFIFIGDIMGHDSQIHAAYNRKTGQYDYNAVFIKVAPIIKSADFAVANLETTLAGPPYKGYPQFSSPDQLAQACKNSGIDALVTANNHCCDRGKQGIIRTIETLDKMRIKHTGTFRNSDDRKKRNLLILNKNNIKVGLLNYTYGTNGMPFPEPTIVNMIDTLQMRKDINQSEKYNLDKLIVVIHWGVEYKQHPNKRQRRIAEFLFNNGVDIIIGSHPHVLERMEYYPPADGVKERFIVYSLGNFVSNQRKVNTDGGSMVKFTLVKKNGRTVMQDKGYYLTWVNKPLIDGEKKFEILPCAVSEANNFEGLSEDAVDKMKIFIRNSRALLNAENVNVSEIK